MDLELFCADPLLHLIRVSHHYAFLNHKYFHLEIIFVLFTKMAD